MTHPRARGSVLNCTKHRAKAFLDAQGGPKLLRVNIATYEVSLASLAPQGSPELSFLGY